MTLDISMCHPLLTILYHKGKKDVGEDGHEYMIALNCDTQQYVALFPEDISDRQIQQWLTDYPVTEWDEVTNMPKTYPVDEDVTVTTTTTTTTTSVEEPAVPATSSTATVPDVAVSTTRDLITPIPASQLSPQDEREFLKAFKVIKNGEMKQWLKSIVIDGTKQNILYAKNGDLRKRFYIPLDLPNCPQFVEEHFIEYFGKQPACEGFVLDTKSGSDKSFVVAIKRDQWHMYLERAGLTDISLRARRQATVKMLCDKLNKREYDSNTGLVHWKKAISLMHQTRNIELTLHEFKLFRFDKAIIPYRKHEDSEVKRLADEIVQAYKQLHMADLAARKGAVLEEMERQDEGVSQEEIDELF